MCEDGTVRLVMGLLVLLDLLGAKHHVHHLHEELKLGKGFGVGVSRKKAHIQHPRNGVATGAMCE